MTDSGKSLEELFMQWSHTRAESIIPLPESGSYRKYYRIHAANKQVMGVYNSDNRENRAFIYLNQQLLKTGNNVPEVYAEDLDKHVYLEKDLGDVTLLDYLADIRKEPDSDEKTRQIYRRVIDAMPGLQVSADTAIDYSVCYPRAEFDVQSMMWDMNYFKYCLLKPLRISFFEQDLEDDFQKIVQWLIKADRKSFMFRDFQSRNIMLHQNELYFIDFQEEEKDLCITIWPHCCLRPKPAFPTKYGRRCWIITWKYSAELLPGSIAMNSSNTTLALFICA
jgi:aminoglycoside/choline kinase family phosphotransferase